MTIIYRNGIIQPYRRPHNYGSYFILIPKSIQLLTNLLAERIEELIKLFTTQRKRTGGERTDKIAVTWATILARREMGESLKAIAEDLEMPISTVKTYVKLARKSLKQESSNS